MSDSSNVFRACRVATTHFKYGLRVNFLFKNEPIAHEIVFSKDHFLGLAAIAFDQSGLLGGRKLVKSMTPNSDKPFNVEMEMYPFSGFAMIQLLAAIEGLLGFSPTRKYEEEVDCELSPLIGSLLASI
jgi:hypothetical protein